MQLKPQYSKKKHFKRKAGQDRSKRMEIRLVDELWKGKIQAKKSFRT
jgi:hypothetical protein